MPEQCFQHVQDSCPLVNCITNMVTVETMANALLALGASPVMADVTEEISDFVSLADALLLNMGVMDPESLRAMHRGGHQANELNKAVVFDPVGLGASSLRSLTAESLLRHVDMTLIRGNISEMRQLAGKGGQTRGVDAALDDKMALEDTARFACEIAKAHHCLIAISGATDVIADADSAYAISGGSPLMARITGSGCVSGAIAAAFLGANGKQPLKAVIAAALSMKLVGEKAESAAAGRGLGHFHTAFIDALSLLSPHDLSDGKERVSRVL